MLHIPGVLDSDRLRAVRNLIDAADWIDGRATAGHLSSRVKANRQLREDDPAARRGGAIILAALEANAVFISSALPSRIVPPLFNRYASGEGYGPHVDGSIRPVGEAARVRTDLSATLFLSDPGDYDGGELCIASAGGEHRLKLPAGDLVIYSARSVHHVEPVSRGERTASFFWIQSIIRDPSQREMLYELDTALQDLAATLPDHRALLALTGHYHNLLRCWADV